MLFINFGVRILLIYIFHEEIIKSCLQLLKVLVLYVPWLHFLENTFDVVLSHYDKVQLRLAKIDTKFYSREKK